MRWSGLWRAASDTTSVRSSSLLPDPVVPARSACGPSRTRSISTTPSAASPSATVGAGSGPLARHAGGDGDGVVDRSRPELLAQLAERDGPGQRVRGERRVLRVAQAGQGTRGVPGVGEGEAGDVDGRRSPGLADRGVRSPAGDADRTDARGRCGTSPARCRPRARAPPRRPTVLAPMKRRSAPVRWARRSGRSVTTTTWRGSSSSSAIECGRLPVGGGGGGHDGAPAGTVREPGRPVPGGDVVDDDQQPPVGRTEPRGELDHDRPQHPAGAGPGHRQRRPLGQLERHGSVGEAGGVGETTAPTSPVSGPSMADPSTTTSQPIVPVPSETRRASACSARRAHRRASRRVTVRTASTTVGVVATWCSQRAVRCTATAAAKRSSSRARRAPARRSTRDGADASRPPTSRRRRRHPPRRAAGTWVTASARPRAPSRRRCNRRR